jgi:hypothetical protein
MTNLSVSDRKSVTEFRIGTESIEKIEGQKLTIGLDLGDRSSWYCMLNAAGEVVLERKLATTPKAPAPLPQCATSQTCDSIVPTCRKLLLGCCRQRIACDLGELVGW